MLQQARVSIDLMDPTISTFLTCFESRIEAAIEQLVAANFDDLLNWRPDLEHRVIDLGETVTALQLA